MVYIKISFLGGGRLGAWVGRDGFSRIFQKQRCNHRSSFKAMEMRADIERGGKKETNKQTNAKQKKKKKKKTNNNNYNQINRHEYVREEEEDCLAATFWIDSKCMIIGEKDVNRTTHVA
jgi:hypothetical protein